MSINTNIHDDTSKINFCNIKKDFTVNRYDRDFRDEEFRWLEIMRIVLSTRLSENDYNGILNFVKSRGNASVDDVQSALVNAVQVACDFNDL